VTNTDDGKYTLGKSKASATDTATRARTAACTTDSDSFENSLLARSCISRLGGQVFRDSSSLACTAAGLNGLCLYSECLQSFVASHTPHIHLHTRTQAQYDSIWDLIEGQLDQKLKSTSGAHEVQLMCVSP
jgi:hypothetical protein